MICFVTHAQNRKYVLTLQNRSSQTDSGAMPSQMLELQDVPAASFTTPRNARRSQADHNNVVTSTTDFEKQECLTVTSDIHHERTITTSNSGHDQSADSTCTDNRRDSPKFEMVVTGIDTPLCSRYQRRVTTTIGIVIMCYMVCMLPMTVTMAIEGWFGSSNVPRNVRPVVWFLASMNSATNPIIYAFRIKELRKCLCDWIRHLTNRAR
jgi:hypothetical protein